MSHKCNDFIIKDGEFVRDFEAMYANIEDPWDQTKVDATSVIVDLAFTAIEKMINTSEQILDIGCANGYHATRFSNIFPDANYLGTDIAPSIIKKAASNHNSNKVSFVADDIRKFNPNLETQFDLIFSSKTLYYVAPEIDEVIQNIKKYLKPNSHFIWIYNIVENAFTKKWLTPELLREKLLEQQFEEDAYIELNRFSDETFVIGMFRFRG